MTATPLPSRGAIGWLGALLAGGMSAAAFGFAFAHAETIFVFLAYFSAVPLFVAGLGTGSPQGLMAGLVAAIALYVKMSPELATSYLIVVAFPVAMLTTLALRYRTDKDGKIYWYPEGYLLTATVLYPCIVFLIALALASGLEGGLIGQTEQILKNAFSKIPEQLSPEQEANFKALIEVMHRSLPATIGCSWAFIMIISAAAAHSILKGQKWNLRDTFAWRDIQLPGWLLIITAVAGLTAVLAPAPFDYAGFNICFILCIPFFLVGLAVVHAYAATIWKMELLFLILFYLLLTIMPWLAILVTLLGALEQVFNFRRKLHSLPKKTGDNQ